MTTYDARKSIEVIDRQINDFGLLIVYLMSGVEKHLPVPLQDLDWLLLETIGEDFETTKIISQYDALCICIEHELELSRTGIHIDMAQLQSDLKNCKN
jgi:hypothetical protein